MFELGIDILFYMRKQLNCNIMSGYQISEDKNDNIDVYSVVELNLGAILF